MPSFSTSKHSIMRNLSLFIFYYLICCSQVFGQIYFKNSAPFKVWVAIGYYVKGDGNWYAKGWYKVEPGQTANIFDYNLLYNRYYYYYAYDEDGNTWYGGKNCSDCGKFIINKKKAFETCNITRYTEEGYETQNFLKIDAYNQSSYTIHIGGNDWCDGDCYNGYGVKKWVSESKKYSGYWQNGQRVGQGTSEYGKFHSKYAGCKFEGTWENNTWKYGTFTWGDGTKYVGNFVNDKRNGKGQIYYNDGTIYDGNWVDDIKSGFGKITWKDKSYQGNWENDKRNGKGRAQYNANHARFPNCSFDGIWKDDYWVEGTLVYADGSKYKGAFQNLNKEGRGILYDSNGKVLKSGIWANDELIQSDATEPVVVWDNPYNAHINVSTSSVNIKACVQSKASLKSVEVYVNDHLDTSRGFSVEDNCAKTINQPIPLQKGKNTVYILATNEVGTTKSDIRTIYYQSNDPAPTPTISSNNYALIIGISDYEDLGIGDLENPVPDAEKLKNTLQEKYTFTSANITLLRNPKKQQIIDNLLDLQNKLTANDNLLIFYAGHGKMQGEQGFWMAADAQISSAYNWLSTYELDGYIKGLKTKHLLLISDACYSGAFVMRDADDIPFETQEKACEILEGKKSRCAMTSGAKTTVPDQSVFMKYLVKELKENPNSCFSAEQLYMNIKNVVMSNSPNRQIPQFGDIPLTGHEGGNFIFKKR